MRFLVLSLLLLASCSVPVPGPPRSASCADRAVPPTTAGIRARFLELHAESGAPGLAACVVLPDGTALQLAAGLADADLGTPLAARPIQLAGSVGKTFFAALALDLVREEKLGLDDRVSRHLGERAWFERLPNARDLTVRMLLQHTSGLVRYEFDPRFAAELARDPDRKWRPEEQLAFVFDAPPPFEAGAGWEYSDTNYILLGLVLESITGTRCTDEIERRFLRPHGLRDTLPAMGRRIPGLVQGHVGDGDPLAPNRRMLVDGVLVFDPEFEWAGGGYASCPRDLAMWTRAVQRGAVFGAELLREARTPVPAPILGANSGYGLGMIRWETPIGVAFGHSGYFPGYLTEVRWFEARGISAAVMTNTSDRRMLKTSLARICVELARAAE